MHLDPAHLSALAAILRTGSFEAAAAEIGLTPPAVSLRIRALEERVGTPLILRGTPCTGTAAGQRLARLAEDWALLQGAALADLDLAAGPARVRIAVNADSLATWFMPALAETEGFLFDLVIDDQDHSAEWLRSGEVLAAVSAERDAQRGCDVIPLGRLRYAATATPEFAGRWFSDGVTAQALSRAPALVFNRKDRIQHDWARVVTGQDIALPAHSVASTHGFRDAMVSGLAWGLNPAPLMEPDMAAGRLVRIHAMTWETPLFWQISRRAAPALSVLTQAVRRAAAAVLEPHDA